VQQSGCGRIDRGARLLDGSRSERSRLPGDVVGRQSRGDSRDLLQQRARLHLSRRASGVRTRRFGVEMVDRRSEPRMRRIGPRDRRGVWLARAHLRIHHRASERHLHDQLLLRRNTMRVDAPGEPRVPERQHLRFHLDVRLRPVLQRRLRLRAGARGGFLHGAVYELRRRGRRQRRGPGAVRSRSGESDRDAVHLPLPLAPAGDLQPGPVCDGIGNTGAVM